MGLGATALTTRESARYGECGATVGWRRGISATAVGDGGRSDGGW
jgi:hypothetical protein